MRRRTIESAVPVVVSTVSFNCILQTNCTEEEYSVQRKSCDDRKLQGLPELRAYQYPIPISLRGLNVARYANWKHTDANKSSELTNIPVKTHKCSSNCIS